MPKRSLKARLSVRSAILFSLQMSRTESTSQEEYIGFLLVNGPFSHSLGRSEPHTGMWSDPLRGTGADQEVTGYTRGFYAPHFAHKINHEKQPQWVVNPALCTYVVQFRLGLV